MSHAYDAQEWANENIYNELSAVLEDVQVDRVCGQTDDSTSLSAARWREGSSDSSLMRGKVDVVEWLGGNCNCTYTLRFPLRTMCQIYDRFRRSERSAPCKQAGDRRNFLLSAVLQPSA